MEHDNAILFSIDLYGRKRFVYVHDLKETCHFFKKKIVLKVHKSLFFIHEKIKNCLERH